MKTNSSWQKVAPWYNKVTKGGEGHYYHQHVVIPNVLRLLELNNKLQMSNVKLLDMACGNGVLGRALPKNIDYLGIDIAPSLISEAKRNDRNFSHKYIVGDVTEPISVSSDFTHAAIILALQNIKNPESALQNVSKSLVSGGKFVIVLNHPAFRIPRQSSWGIDETKKTQYRRIDRYMSPLEIPIHIHPHTKNFSVRVYPSDRTSQVAMSYHFPISDYSKMLKDVGFVIEAIEEWTSDKESVGRAGKMENRARNEIPLFMTIVAKKLDF
ncbi:MAG TPA: class I SAM-dependent methyltransferase [Patescibacteria group bacterium]|nr:class I SAM-dependent methyltransferase [Patescibacteria group bacterium]